MSVYSGDFLGFRLGNIHSSQLNITRVSNNDRYTENLTPVFKDQTTDIIGNDGTYYWGTYYTQQNFVIDFAFDNLREEDIRRLRTIFSFKGIQELVFDETPHKKYMVKCSNPPTLKYIAFDEDGITVYRGEGTLNLISYYPFGISTNEIVIPKNTNETSDITQHLFNTGDLETSFKIYFSSGVENITINLISETGETSFIKLQNIIPYQGDIYICIDMRTNLIEGMDANFQKMGHLYNQFKTGGDFFKAPVGDNILQISTPFEKISYYNIYY